MGTAFHWVERGFKEAFVMLWMTWWPLVFGFTISGFVQSFFPRNGLRSSLGTTSIRSLTRASLLGMISSSCSYAASGMSRALFSKGSTWTNSLVFMVASTNLVIELGIVIVALLGVSFLIAQLVGGVIMIALLAFETRWFFSPARERALLDHVQDEQPTTAVTVAVPWRERLRTPSNYVSAARYSVADLRMLRRELVAGFIVAGFLAVDVSASWWSKIFVTGHGAWTIAENIVVAPILAILSCVCSVGNIPLAAAFWSQGISFGGVVAFIFADLITLPLLFIYVRLYGRANAWRLFLLLWSVMSLAGLFVQLLFAGVHEIPSHRLLQLHQGDITLGWTLWLNIVATMGMVLLYVASRQKVASTHFATDPICGMQVDTSAPAATIVRDGTTYYFCSPRCASKFQEGTTNFASGASTIGHDTRFAVDPICGMDVEITADAVFSGEGDKKAYFCCTGCRDSYEANLTAQ